MRVARAILLTAALAGCRPPTDAALSAAEWRVLRACGQVRLPDTVRVTDAYLICGAQPSTVGCWAPGSRTLSLSRHAGSLEQVAVHELLHVLGATHVPAGHGIMAASESAAVPYVTAEDLDTADCLWRHPEKAP